MKANIALRYWFFALVLTVATLTGCSRQPEARSDAQIAGDVQSKINNDPNLPNKQVTVNANAGVVTLSGTVGSEMERAAAGNAASQVEGVRTVVNNLSVGADQQAAIPEPEPQQSAAPAQRRQPDTRFTPRRTATPRPSPSTSASAGSSADYGARSNAAPAASATPAPIARVTVPEGTQLTVRTITHINSETAEAGDTFQATLDQPIYMDDQIVIPDNADVEGRVVEVRSAGKFKGQSALTIELTRITVNGRSYQINTDQWSRQGSSRGKNTAAKVGGGAALGAIIGGIAGGGKGAAIGAAAGAGAGTGVQAITKGQQIDLKPETLLTFRLQAPVAVTPTSSRNR